MAAQITATFPDLDFPHRGELERSAFVQAQENSQDILSGTWNTASTDFKNQANNLSIEVNNKEANVVSKHDVVVAKEALMNPHYAAIDNVSTNMTKVSNLDNNMAKISTVDTNIVKIVSVADNEANINIVATNIGSITNKIGVTDIHNATSKATPADADEFALLDSESSFGLKKVSIDKLRINEHFSKQNKKAVVFTKTAPAGFDVLPNKVELPNGTIANNTSAVSLSLNTNLDTGSKLAGYDYYVYCTASNTYNISRDKTKTDGTIIGGFHYGLVPETEAPTGNKTEAWMIEQRGIWSHSFWDLKFKPNSKYEEGKNYSNGKWVDIYQADEDIAIRGHSSPWKSVGVKAKIAAGTTDYGRGIPKIPLDFGGNGTVTYGKFTWFQACEIAKSLGMRLLTYEEFSPLAYGVTESVSSLTNGYETTAGAIEHYPHLTSRYMEQATGVQWIWGADVGGNYGTTDWAWRNNTDTRGQIFSTSNDPTVLLGGFRGDGAYAGSRASNWNSFVWNSTWNVGCRFACDDLELV